MWGSGDSGTKHDTTTVGDGDVEEPLLIDSKPSGLEEGGEDDTSIMQVMQ